MAKTDNKPDETPPPPSIKCPRCGMISFHPKDIEERYCAACHLWHDDPVADELEGQEPVNPDIYRRRKN